MLRMLYPLWMEEWRRTEKIKKREKTEGNQSVVVDELRIRQWFVNVKVHAPSFSQMWDGHDDWWIFSKKIYPLFFLASFNKEKDNKTRWKQWECQIRFDGWKMMSNVILVSLLNLAIGRSTSFLFQFTKPLGFKTTKGSPISENKGGLWRIGSEQQVKHLRCKLRSSCYCSWKCLKFSMYHQLFGFTGLCVHVINNQISLRNLLFVAVDKLYISKLNM